MSLPKAFTDDRDLDMCYEKKVILHESVFLEGDLNVQVEIIHKLLQCMKEWNALNKHDFPFYQLRVRPARWYEGSGQGGVCFELRWGNRKMLPELEK